MRRVILWGGGLGDLVLGFIARWHDPKLPAFMVNRCDPPHGEARPEYTVDEAVPIADAVFESLTQGEASE